MQTAFYCMLLHSNVCCFEFNIKDLHFYDFIFANLQEDYIRNKYVNRHDTTADGSVALGVNAINLKIYGNPALIWKTG